MGIGYYNGAVHIKDKKPATGLYNWVLSNKIQQPIKLEILLVKTVFDKTGNGNDARYFKVSIGGMNVTQMVAETTNLSLSKAKNSYGCVIVHGSGMDMGFALQERMYRYASQAGYPKMFDMNDYIYLGKEK